MSAGTITVTNDSDVIQGDGTAFDKDLVANDMVVCVIGGVTYTLVVKTIDSATQVTLLKKYDGPTQAGAAWYAVPRKAMNLITAQLSAEAVKAMHGLNYDKQNWQQVFSGAGDITVKLPDGSTYTGPAWNNIASALNLKADKTELDKKADKAELDKKANKSDLGNSASRDVGTTANTVAAGDDMRLNTINGKTGGLINGIVRTQGVNGLVVDACTAIGWDGTNGVSEFVNNRGGGIGGYRYRIANHDGGLLTQFEMRPDGTLVAQNGSFSVNGRVRAFSSVNPTSVELFIDGQVKGITFFDSDERLKEQIKDIEKGHILEKLKSIRPVSYKFKDTYYKENGENKIKPGKSYSYGVIAQDIVKIIPDAVITMSNGNMSLDPLSVIGFLLAVNKVMLERVERQDELINAIRER
ncbi:hypothetical protein SME38J_05140 [Serratia marcescens]|nr:hypothetical protein SME38J_05140 [Serratia marcescens]